MENYDFDELMEFVNDGLCPAECEHGCIVEPDGYCEHGKPSTLLAMGLI